MIHSVDLDSSIKTMYRNSLVLNECFAVAGGRRRSFSHSVSPVQSSQPAHPPVGQSKRLGLVSLTFESSRVMKVALMGDG